MKAVTTRVHWRLVLCTVTGFLLLRGVAALLGFVGLLALAEAFSFVVFLPECPTFAPLIRGPSFCWTEKSAMPFCGAILG